MEIMRVMDELVCTRRVPGLKSASLRVLEGQKGGLVVADKPGGTPAVAVDAVGCIPGDWVICVGSSAARDAAGSKEYPSDLTIVGIIDHWESKS